MRHPRLAGVLCVFLFLIASNRVLADQNFGAEAHTQAQVITPNGSSTKNGADNDPFQLNAAAHSSTSLGRGVASTGAKVGVIPEINALALHAFAYSDVFIVPPLTDSATASASAQWRDTLTITSDTLAVGTPTTVQLGIRLHATFTVRSCPFQQMNSASAAGTLFITGTLRDTFRQQQAFACEDLVRDNGVTTFNTFVGDTLIVKAILGAEAGSQGGTFITDAGNTMRFSIEPLSPDVSYTTASGYSYRTPVTLEPVPVPEPAIYERIGNLSSLHHDHAVGGLIRASDGNLYGMTGSGGAGGLGGIYRVASDGTVTLLHEFMGAPADIGPPLGELVEGSDGNFYGLAFGATSNAPQLCGPGVIFRVSPAGAVSVAHAFAPFDPVTGSFPEGAVGSGANACDVTAGATSHRLTRGPDGNLYGTVVGGGLNGTGTIFRLTTMGEFSVINQIDGTRADGTRYGGPTGLTLGSDGNFYGVASRGGLLFRVTPQGVLTKLHEFAGAPDGESVWARPEEGIDGNFYGIVKQGPCGTVYRLTPDGIYDEILSMPFDPTRSDDCPAGQFDAHPLITGANGRLYGVAEGGGEGYGTVVEISLAGQLRVLHTFGGGRAPSDGYQPAGRLLETSAGVLYGATAGFGGTHVYRLTVSAPPAVDATAPSASPTQLPVPNAAGWNNNDVIVTWNWRDDLGGSGIDPSNCTGITTSSGEGNPIALTASCNDVAGNTGSASYNVKIDRTAPTITAAANTAPNAAGWYNGPVTVTFTCADGLSGVPKCAGPEVLSTEGAAVASTAQTAKDAADNTSTPSNVVVVKIDVTPPTVSFSGGPTNGGTYYYGEVPTAPTCAAADGLSGLAGACAVAGYGTAVGPHTVIATASDNAGNRSSASGTYTVNPWTLNGFYQPIDMSGIWNVVKGGSTVPIKFEVFAGSTELVDPSIVVQPLTASEVSCDGGAADEIELTAAGSTSLQYDITGGQFIYNWQTPKKPGFCYVVTVALVDGTSRSAKIKLK